MKTRLFITCVISAISTYVSAQILVTQVKPAGSKTWGYANLKGELVIPATYGKCYRFSSEGLAPIYIPEDKQYYFINLKNERLAVEGPAFKIKDGFGFDVTGFQNGLALIKQNEKWGYINPSGKQVIAAKYDDGSDFKNGHATVKSAGKYFVINTKGEEFPVEGSPTDVRDYSEGFAPFATLERKFGYVSADGKIAISAQFEGVGYFTNGLAWAKSGGQVGYINTKGEWVIKPQFTAGKDFDKESGLARVKVGEKWGYVSKTGEILNVDSESFGDFSEGLCEGKKNGKKGFYNNKGEWVITPQFDGVRDFKNGYAAAKSGEKWGMIDKKGNWVIQPSFDGIKDMELVK
jgi:hypothetical protein